MTSSYDKVNTKESLGINSTTVIDVFPTDFGCAAFFEYCVTESGGNKRMGQVYGVWDTLSADFTDVSSPDLNGSTANFVWKLQINSGNVELVSNILGGTWDVLVATRIIF